MTYIAEKIVKARKPHVCEACGSKIPAKSRYSRYVGINDGSAFTFHYHVECRVQEISVNRRAGTQDEEWMTLSDDIEGGGVEVLDGYDPIVAYRMLKWVKRGKDHVNNYRETYFIDRIADLQMIVNDMTRQRDEAWELARNYQAIAIPAANELIEKEGSATVGYREPETPMATQGGGVKMCRSCVHYKKMDEDEPCCFCWMINPESEQNHWTTGAESFL